MSDKENNKRIDKQILNKSSIKNERIRNTIKEKHLTGTQSADYKVIRQQLL